jgi:transcriptional regulator with XRE-family HTH domain
VLLPAAREAAAQQRYGALLRLARTAAGLTLAQAGQLAGYSAATLSRLERSVQPLTDVRVLRRLASVLAIPPNMFGLADTPPTPSTRKAPQATTLADQGDAGQGGPVRRRQFLGVATAVAATPLRNAADPSGHDPGRLLVARLENVVHQPSSAPAAMPVDRVREGMIAAKADFQASRYRRLAERLPALLATATADAGTDPAVLAELYNTATHVLIKLEVSGSGWLTAERALTAARASGDPAVIANVTRNAATLYRRAGRYDLAEHLALDAAEQLPIARSNATVEHLSLYGMLLCNAAYSAARAGDRSRAHELLDHANQTADRLGADRNAYWTAFGPINVISYRISAAHALGDAGTAIAHAARVPPGAIRIPERLSRYWIDVARAYHQWGQPARCYQALLGAERHAPEEVRSRPAVRTLAVELLSTPRQTGMTSLREFATRVGVAG